jgi:oligopeptide transport system substrate-binding protein
MNIRNRWFLLVAGTMSAMLVVGAACSSGTSSSDKTATAAAGGGKTPAAGKTTAATSATGGQAPADQQKITVQSAEPQFYDPHRSSFEQDIGVERMLFRGLYNLTDDGAGGVKVEPGLAAGEPTVSGNVYTVKLKDGLKWSDGVPLTAQHFVDGAKRGCDPTVAADYGYIWGPGYVDLVGCEAAQTNTDPTKAQALLDALSARAVDDKTVEFTLKQPNGRFTTLMALWVTFPARLDVVKAKGDRWTDPGSIVTNGPFTLKEVTPKDHATLVPNPNWTGKKPALQEITIKFIDDLSAAFRSYQSGELDLTRISASDIAVAKGDSKIKDEILIDPTGRITALEMNTQAPSKVLGDFNVRLALSRAIDRAALNEAVFDGTNTPATYWVVKGLKGHQGNAPFDSIMGFNADAAKKALADAGYPGGAGFPELGIIVNTPERKATAEFLQQQFKTILGINIRVDQVDSPTRAARFRDEQFELFIGGWQIDYPDIENTLFGLFETEGGNNHYNCTNPDVDAALKRALAATSDDARIKAYQDMETAIIKNLCGVAPMWQDSVPFMVDKKLGGIVANGSIDAGLPGNYCAECWFVKAS